MTFYLKYRSKTIDELDLEEVRKSLSNIVKSDQIPHAFLFSGPKGSGKTSAARILAKVVNCEKFDKKKGEPCNKCSSCLSITRGDNLDIIEIDAASHRGIDDIRALRDAVKLSPASAKKKVYIIDEAHMLTTEASNALLKTLEEPPDHVIFVLATTNPEKLIETIRSRTVNISFTKARRDEIIRSLSRIIKEEKLKAEKEVLEVIASSSDGSFRDAIKILEELVIANISLDKQDVERYLFNKKVFDPDKFVEILKGDDEKFAYQEIEKAIEKGVSIKNITTMILERLREILLMKVGVSGEDRSSFTKEEVLELLRLISRSYSEVSYAVLEQIPLELAISEWFEGKSKNSAFTKASTDKQNSQPKVGRPLDEKSETDGGLSKNTDNEKNSSNEVSIQKNKVEKSVTDKEEEIKNTILTNGLNDEIWTRILTEIKETNTSTEALLRAAKPLGFDGKILTLGVYYKFHKEKLETNFHRGLMESVLNSVTGSNVRVVCTLTEPPLKVSNQDEAIQKKPENGTALTGADAVLAEGEDEDIVRVAKEIFGS